MYSGVWWELVFLDLEVSLSGMGFLKVVESRLRGRGVPLRAMRVAEQGQGGWA